MSQAPGSGWRGEALERFADGELSEAQRAELAADLLRDAALRSRLVSIQDRDALARQALERPDVKRVRRIRWARVGIAAAVMLLAMARPWGWGFSRPGGAALVSADRVEPIARVEPSAEAGAVAGGSRGWESAGARVVISIPVRRRMGPDLPEASRYRVPAVPRVLWDAPLERPDDFLPRFELALRSGRGEDAREMLAAADERDRRAAYRYISELFQSTEAAEVVLTGLPLDEQVRVCREWARTPGIRSVAFRRLRELQGEPSVQAQLRGVLEELSRDARTDAWLRGYGLTSG